MINKKEIKFDKVDWKIDGKISDMEKSKLVQSIQIGSHLGGTGTFCVSEKLDGGCNRSSP